MPNPKIAIITDSSANIPAEVQGGLNIHTIPLWLVWDNENYQDGVDITPSEFFSRLKTSPNLPTSSQPTAGEFLEFFRRIFEETDADAIVNVLASSNISGTVACAEKAASQVPDLNVRVVDSLSSAMGLGLSTLAAARAAAAGKSLDEVVEAAEEMVRKNQMFFVVDTLEYLHKGGRISGGKRLLGTALQIKPLLHFEEGYIRPYSQARTKRKAIELLLTTMEQRLAGQKMAEAAVMDVDAPEAGDDLAERVEARFAPLNLFRAGVSPVVGTHVGPGTVGVAFYGVG